MHILNYMTPDIEIDEEKLKRSIDEISRNIRIARRNINDLYFISNQFVGATAFFTFVIDDKDFINNYYEMSSKNAAILLYELINGKINIKRVKNDILIFLSRKNDDISFRKEKENIKFLSKKVDEIYTTHKEKLSFFRNSVAAHNDLVNANDSHYFDDKVITISSEDELLSSIEELFSKLLFVFSKNEYVKCDCSIIKKLIDKYAFLSEF